MGYDAPKTKPEVDAPPAAAVTLEKPRRRKRDDAPVSVLNQSLEERASSGLSYRLPERGRRDKRRPFSSGGF